jgi:hypothetical protein
MKTKGRNPQIVIPTLFTHIGTTVLVNGHAWLIWLEIFYPSNKQVQPAKELLVQEKMSSRW